MANTPHNPSGKRSAMRAANASRVNAAFLLTIRYFPSALHPLQDLLDLLDQRLGTYRLCNIAIKARQNGAFFVSGHGVGRQRDDWQTLKFPVGANFFQYVPAALAGHRKIEEKKIRVFDATKFEAILARFLTMDVCLEKVEDIFCHPAILGFIVNDNDLPTRQICQI